LTLHARVQHARAELVRAGISTRNDALDSELLARHILRWDRATWLLRRSEPADAAFASAYEAVLGRRLAREPVAYIRGVQEFWSRDFRVTPAVLIPRPETELVVEIALAFMAARADAVVADVGTGSGCLAATLALELPRARVWATDISGDALAVARDNAARLGAAVGFLQGPYLDGVPRPIDLVVSNPPYVAEHDRPGLAPEVAEHEPAVALFGGDDGWRDVRAVLRESSEALAMGGRLVMEMGYGQSEQISSEIAGVDGLVLEEIRADLQGIPRVVIARRVGGDA